MLSRTMAPVAGFGENGLRLVTEFIVLGRAPPTAARGGRHSPPKPVLLIFTGIIATVLIISNAATCECRRGLRFEAFTARAGAGLG